MVPHPFSPSPDTKFWNLKLTDTVNTIDPAVGLSTEEASRRFTQYGPNLITERSHAPLWLQFLLRFRNPLVLLLLLASALSAITGDIPSFVVISTIVLLSVTLGFFQEMHAEKSIAALRHSVAIQATVLRDGNNITIPVANIVPGDIVELSAGALVPADGRLLACKDIYVNQSLLTGESLPVEKHIQDLETPTTQITQANNSVFMGTSIISGTGLMIVVNTGKNTYLGQLAHLLGHTRPPTDFERGVEKFGMLILRIAISMVIFVLVVNLYFDRPLLESFLFALALAVGLTPELLPMMVTITLSRGAIRMAQEKVIVKHLPAMHNLGAMDILCTDKTGTLTESTIHLAKSINIDGLADEKVFLMTFLNSYFESGIKSPLDQAILAQEPPNIQDWKKIDEVPFDFERRRVSVLLQFQQENFLIVKGAPEDVIKLSTAYETATGKENIFDAKQRNACLAQFEALGAEGYRVLAVAYRKVPITHQTAIVTDESTLVFLGFAVFLDPPKLDAAETLKQLKRDGIHVKVITGDNERVTQHVCKMLNFDTGKIITGDELSQWDNTTLQREISTTHVFCRITPEQKSRIIMAFKTKGHTVGFIGDGINDAPAIHIADVGISVDSGTESAKEAADIILLEHSLSVIHRGVMEGRRAVLNTRKYILMGSSSNFGNMLSMAGAALVLPFLPMLPIQILLNNLLYDISQTAIPFDNVDKTALSKPVHWDMRHIKHFMGVLGPISSLFDFITFYVLLKIFHANEIAFHTGWFVESMITQVLIIFSIRTTLPFFLSRPHFLVVFMALLISTVAVILPFTPFNTWLGFSPLSTGFFIFLAAAVVVYFVLVEISKWIFRRYI